MDSVTRPSRARMPVAEEVGVGWGGGEGGEYSQKSMSSGSLSKFSRQCPESRMWFCMLRVEDRVAPQWRHSCHVWICVAR